MSTNNVSFFASCPKFIEGSLAQEISSFSQCKNPVVTKGGVKFEGPIKSAVDFSLNSRFASRLFMLLEEFEVFGQDEIYKKCKLIDWTELFSPHESFKVNVIFDKDAKKKFKNSLFISQLIKDSIVDVFIDNGKKRPSVDTKSPRISFTVRIEGLKEGFKVSLSLDLSGTPLSNRGIRRKGHQAPLRENVAAYLVNLMNVENRGDFFLDPMCGTGTLGIEYFFNHYSIAPSIFKLKEKGSDTFAFQRHKWFRNDKDLKEYYETEKNKILEVFKNLNPNPEFQILLSDTDQQTIRHLDTLLSRLRISHFFEVKIQDCKTISSPGEKGQILTNPPFGVRLGEEKEAIKLIHDFGETLKNNFKNCEAYILAPSPEMRKAISLRTSARHEVHNGDIECRLLKYELF